MSFLARLWERRWFRVVAKTGGVLVGLRVLLSLAAPVAVTVAAKRFDFDARYDNLSLSVFGGSAELRGLVVRERGATADAPALLAIDYGLVDVSMLALLRGELAIERAEIDDVRARLERRADGSVPWNAHLGLDRASEPEPPRADEAPPKPLDFTPPLRVDALRALRVSIELVDHAAAPAIDEELVCELRVNGVGSTDEPATFEASASSPRLLGSARASGRLRGAPRELAGDLDWALDRFHAKPLAGWLRTLGLEPIADDVSARGAARIAVTPNANSAERCDATARVHSVRVEADGASAFELGEVRVGPLALAPGSVSLDEIAIEDVKLALARNANGRLAAAGFELLPSVTAAPDDATARPKPLAFPSLPIEVARLSIAHVAATLDDRAVTPANTLEARLESLVVARDDSARTQRLLSAVAVAPGIFERATLEGRVTLAEPELALELALDVAGFQPERVRPQLAALGLEPWKHAGRFTTRVAANAKIAGGKLSDGRVTLGPTTLAYPEIHDSLGELAFGTLDASGLAFDPLAKRIDVARLDASGLRAVVARDERGRWFAAGFRTLSESGGMPTASEPAAPSAPIAPGAPGASSAPFVPPELRVGEVALHDLRLEFRDSAVAPATKFVTDALEASLHDLALGAPAQAPATFEARLSIGGLLADARARGEFATSADGRRVELAATCGVGDFTPAALAPYTAALGLEPVVERLQLGATLHARANELDGAWSASLSLGDAALGDGMRSLASLHELSITDARITNDGTLVAKELVIDAPALAAERDTEGKLRACGWKLAGAPKATPEPPVENANEASAAAAANSPLVLPRVRIERVALRSAAFDWSDAAVTPLVATRATFDGTIEPLRVGHGAPDAKPEELVSNFDFRGDLGPELPSAHVAGRAYLQPDALGIRAHFDGARLRAGVLAAYLPPQLAVELVEGRASCELELGSSRIQALGYRNDGMSTWDAGRSLDVEVRDARLTDRERDPARGERELARLDRFALHARIDPAARGIEIDDLALAGAALDVRRSADGTLHAAGVALAPATASSRSPAAAAPIADVAPQAQPGPNTAAGAANVAPAKVADAPAVRRAGLAQLTLAKADLELARLAFVDETLGAAAEPLVLAARATLADVALAGAVANAPPMRAEFSGSLAPFCGGWSATLELGEENGEPVLDAAFSLDGLDGAALTRALPALAERIDGAGLRGGTLRASAKARLSAARSADRALDFASPFGAEIELGPIEYRATPDGEVLAGLDGGKLDVTKVDAARGVVAIRSIELQKPRGRIVRDAQGLHVLGLTLRLPAAGASESSTASGAPSETANASAASAASAEVAAANEAHSLTGAPSATLAPAGELSIDRLNVTGLDFLLADTSVTPPAIVPLTDLDFELRKFTTRALVEERAFYFNALVTAGKVDVPKRVASDSLFEGVAEAVGGALSGGSDEQVTLEQRPLFDEVALAGRISLHPELRGWVNVGVSALELTDFRGLAAAAGVTLGDGVLDATVRARLQGERGISIEARPTFSYLSLAEPTGGPISRYLTLPAPLDTVLFLLKDAEDQHKVPVDVHVDANGLSTAELVSAAAGAATRVIARAIASAPLRVLGGLGGLFGDDEQALPTDDTIALAFVEGGTELGEPAHATLDGFLRRFGENDRFAFSIEHRFARGDVERARRLANPSAEECRELSEHLRRKKAELVRHREELAARARVDYAVGRASAAAAATVELRALDRELGQNEDALDRVHELLKPGAEKRVEQRTKAALIAIALERLALLKGELVARGVDPSRLQFRSLKIAPDAALEASRITLTPRKRE